MKPSTLLELGRVSNLPTVWSNVLCGAVLSGERLVPGPLLVAGVAGSSFYVGGMLLNDAFDAEIDARERPERAIPQGRVTRREVFVWGFGLLLAGIALLTALAALGISPSGVMLPLAGAATALCVIVYDRWHKGFPFSPLVMGLCRAGLYVIGALTVAPVLAGGVVDAAVALGLYVVGLTHIARFENASAVGRTWPSAFVLAPFALAALAPTVWRRDLTTVFAFGLWFASVLVVLFVIRLALLGGPLRIRRAVISLIAGISLVDATFAASRARVPVALLAIGAFFLTLRLQRKIRGT